MPVPHCTGWKKWGTKKHLKNCLKLDKKAKVITIIRSLEAWHRWAIIDEKFAWNIIFNLLVLFVSPHLSLTACTLIEAWIWQMPLTTCPLWPGENGELMLVLKKKNTNIVVLSATSKVQLWKYSIMTFCNSQETFQKTPWEFVERHSTWKSPLKQKMCPSFTLLWMIS